MKYLLDTDTLTFLYDDQRIGHVKALEKVETLPDTDCLCVSVLSLFELEYSYANATDEIKKNDIHNTIDDIKNRAKDSNEKFLILPVDEELAKFYAEIKVDLRQKEGKSRESLKKCNIDILLASTALKENCVIVSGDGIYQKIAKHKPLQFQKWW